MYSCVSEIPWLFNVEKKKITEDGENVSFALAKKLLLTSKSSLWPTFYQAVFMKR